MCQTYSAGLRSRYCPDKLETQHDDVTRHGPIPYFSSLAGCTPILKAPSHIPPETALWQRSLFLFWELFCNLHRFVHRYFQDLMPTNPTPSGGLGHRTINLIGCCSVPQTPQTYFFARTLSRRMACWIAVRTGMVFVTKNETIPLLRGPGYMQPLPHQSAQPL